MNGETSLFEFMQKFPDEQSCVNFLEMARFPDGNIKSPFGEKGALKIKTRPGLYKCRETGKNFSVRQGTIFEESRLPLHKWFFAIFLLHSLKKGISSVQIAKTIGVTQKTAWFMLHRVRYAVEHQDFMRPLDGIVEIDEHYSGGSKKGGKRGRGAEKKSPILGMVERDGGEIRVEAVKDCKKATLVPIIRRNVKLAETCVVTDDFVVYNNMDRIASEHHSINHSAKQYVRDGNVHTNTIEGFWSHLKLGIRAIQIHVSRKHLNRYCKEYQFRYNHRKVSDFQRFCEWMNICSGRLTYAQLIDK
jgi:transposase-like protein